MTKERIAEFIGFSKDESKKQNGYVYVGRGSLTNSLGGELGIKRGELHQFLPTSKIMDRGENSGSERYCEYYIKKSKWNELFAEKETENPEPLESRIAAAQEHIGKDIVSLYNKNRHGVVKRVAVCLSEESGTKDFGLDKRITQKHFKNGPEILLLGGWSDGAKMVRVFDNNSLEIYVEKIKVNGFDAEDMGEYYKFGCAQIQKSQLKRAKEFLIETNKGLSGYCNRKTESVKIGQGDFTLDILNKLNL
jgi:hypothetical protein